MIRRLALGSALLLAAPFARGPAEALTFAFTTISGDTLGADQAAAFQSAASVWSANLTDPITVTINVGFRSLGGNDLGSTSPNYVIGTNGSIVSALGSDAKDAADAQAVASLANDTQTSLLVSYAQGRALGLNPGTGNDGTIEFNSDYAFSTARDANGGIASGTYDLIGIAEHEIGHLLGFVSSLDYPAGTPQTLLDQFRYTSPGTRSDTPGQTAYLSIDGGTTNMANFSIGGTGNDQASHWLAGTRGVMVPEAAAGQTQDITTLDIQALDAIGYDVATAVPEPSALALLAVGVAGVAMVRRRTLARNG